MNESSDKTTITISPAGQEVLTALMDAKYFRTELGAFLAVAALAMAKNLEVSKDLAIRGATKWNKGSGSISEWSELATWYLPTSEPIKALEIYGHAGLSYVADRLKLGATFSDLFLP
jgi:hypothetical protein